MRILPPSYSAWAHFILGTLLLLFALRAQTPLWGVVFGMQPAPPDGSHYAGAVVYGLPPMLMSGLVLGLTAAKKIHPPLLNEASLAVTLLVIFGWLVLVIKELI